ncbi:MAG: hypothetical protein HY336_00940 [Candidatus Doudnabacteria bacterium]|nr:hypothetical protein [Candidatus Doudnabacteria bacterium]
MANLDPTKDKKEEYAKLVCFFLAEQLRVHKISLRRACEIGQKVLDNINLVESEEDFLRLVSELSKDFEELLGLEKRTFFYVEETKRSSMEQAVRDFVILNLVNDMPQAVGLLSEAVKESADTSRLCQLFPKFSQFLKEKK